MFDWGGGIRRAGAATAVVASAVTITGCSQSAEPRDLVLRGFGPSLPTQVAPLPAGLSVSPHTIVCRAARVTGGTTGRYSVLVTENDFLHVAPSMPARYITVGIRIRTSSRAYDTYLDSYDISYEPLNVSISPELVSEQQGGAPMGGVFVPGAPEVSRKQLLDSRSHSFDHDPATTFTIGEIPTACEITVRTGYRPGQSVEIRIVP
jgi:hypothetical protein